MLRRGPLRRNHGPRSATDKYPESVACARPATYPRTAAIAYAMDYKELESVIDNANRSGARLKAFYHSHPNHDAYFSPEDKAFASPFDEPTFPGAAQIVVSIYDRTVKRIAAFVWSNAHKDFIEVPVAKAPQI